MFGGNGLFSVAGEDVNANALGADPAGETNNSSGYYPGSMDTAGETSNPGDPAMRATQEASSQSDKIASQQSNAMAIAGGINKSVGLFSSIEGLVGPRAKRLAKRQRVYARHQAQFAYNQAIRARDQYAADVAVERQKLAQSYSGRGLGESSIQQEGMKYFEDTAARKAAQLEENITLAHMGQQVVTSQIAASYSQTWLSLGNSVANMV